ncbi:MAG: AAA family ATPase [Nitrosomonadales bacterium]|nr:AAA family ATPase [Nitrosomonadales bacterium]
MYLEHFGLSEHPFKITPVTEFFFSGANRQEILDALIYSISEVEGIIKVSGEVGSGKTMICRMLLEKLPAHIETIYLANPSLSREEMLYAIADALGLGIEGERVGIIMQRIQNRLEEKAREGKRVAVLVDEAHAMPLDTLEELRLLYNLQVGNFKLLQIILFGQPELNAKLDQPNMRQLKDRIVHHFNMQPLSRDILENYLMFRMRTAGYHGPTIFSPAALKQIANASSGLMRRANVLADKSLLAAFIENTHNIEPRHVQAAMRDSELKPTRRALTLPDKKWLLGIATAILLLLAGLVGWWMVDEPRQPPVQASTQPAQVVAASPPALPQPEAEQTAQPDNTIAPVAKAPSEQPQPTTPDAPATPASKPATDTVAPVVATPPQPAPPAVKTSLFEQRLAAGKQMLAQHQAVASIQLFYNERIQPDRMEGFLKRADKLGVLAKIYLLPAKFGNQDGLRVLYGAYPSVDAARNAIKDLPSRYQEAFATSIHVF